MNYIALMNYFHAKDLEYSFTPNETAVYVHLLHRCNQLGWKNPFNFSVDELQAKLRLRTKDPLDTARNRLKQAGLIDFKNGQGRGYTTQYSLFDPEAPAEKGGKKGQKNTPYTSPFSPPFSPPFSGVEKPLVHKTETKPNKTKQGANAPSAGGEVESKNEGGATFNEWRAWCAANLGQHGISLAPPEFCTFAIFWDAYGKKVDTKKSQKKWESLPLATRQLALASLPAYVAAQPEKQYRKDPMTWLNGECWNDEIIPRKAATGATGQPPAPVVGSLAEKVSTQSKRRYE